MTFSPLNRRLDGFRNTPFLWNNSLKKLQIYKPTNLVIHTKHSHFDEPLRIRLGKLIELFVLYDLEQDPNLNIVQSNLQVFKNRITIGEIDCLIKQLEEHIHLEIVYKFYLYDPTFPKELDRWIGPNRNDSLIQKLRKLQEKQLPLLFHEETEKLLQELNLKAENFKQQLYFKAQLFVPFENHLPTLPLVNNACIKGFYIRPKELISFSNHTFFVPTKLDWLIEPYLQVQWVTLTKFQDAIAKLLCSYKSPLCWIKSPEGKMQKFFIVWWD